MSEEKTKVSGPVMFCATSVMKTPPARIGRISKDITLPRAIEVKKLLAGFVGAIVGLLFALLVGKFLALTFVSISVSIISFGFLGVFAISYSPLKGESLLKWIGLSIRSAQTKVQVTAGLSGTAYIGIAPVIQIASDKLVKIVPSGIEVSAGSFDERGVLLKTSKVSALLSEQVTTRVRQSRPRATSDTWRSSSTKTSGSFISI